MYSRWVIFFDETIRKFLDVPRYVVWMLKYTSQPKVSKTLYTVGIGRHSNEEVQQMMRADLKRFSDLLGMLFE